MRPVRRPRPDDDEQPPPRWLADERGHGNDGQEGRAPRGGQAHRHAHEQHHHREHHRHRHQHNRHHDSHALSRLAHSAQDLLRALGASPVVLGAWTALKLGGTVWAVVVLVRAARARREGRVRLEGEEDEGEEGQGQEKV